jgi:hypothetical protein
MERVIFLGLCQLYFWIESNKHQIKSIYMGLLKNIVPFFFIQFFYYICINLKLIYENRIKKYKALPILEPRD